MTREEYSELVEYIEDRFGPSVMDTWTARVYPDFENLESDVVWEALLAKLDSDPKAEFPPKPPALRAAVLDRVRHNPRPALPETTEKYGWATYSQKTYGKVIPLAEAIERRAAELGGEK